MLVSPVLAGLAVAIGVPILLFYVYGVVPGMRLFKVFIEKKLNKKNSFSLVQFLSVVLAVASLVMASSLTLMRMKK
jgi:hypothetical protein